MSDEFKREEALGWLINIVAYHMRLRLDKHLKTKDLSIGQWPVLVSLWEQDGVYQNQISERLKAPEYTMSRAIDKLEEMNLVRRETDLNNRRAQRIFLTEEGHQIRQILTPFAMQTNEEILALLDEQEGKQLLSLLKKIVQQL
jgi:DNA-binding MarR family transcriptional regulator